MRFSLQFAQSCCTKRTAHIRAVRFFVSSWMCAKTPSVRNIPPQPLRLLFLFFKKRNRPPSFLFRRKEAKENHLRNRIPRCACRFRGSATQERTAHIRAGRFFCFKLDVREKPFCSKSPLSRYVFCFFSSRKEIVPLLFFLEEKKQKKIICRICFCASLYILRNPVAQNGRLTYEPAVLFVSSWMCGKPPSVRKAPSAALSFVSFLQEKKSFPKRNRSLKEIVP